VITVAGTNGKGSVAAFCTSILGAAGYRVGTFTSPHLRDYRERIRVHDRLVRALNCCAAFERIEALRAARGDVSLTFFEYNALAALLVFEAARSMPGCSRSAWAGAWTRSMSSIRRSPSW
jgi:dihydrofolate synthase/folylpolyglutamate synthase